MLNRAPIVAAGLLGFVLFWLSGYKWLGAVWGCATILLVFKVHPVVSPGTERLFSPELREALIERDGKRCVYCGRPVHYRSACPIGGCDLDLEADHVEAHSTGGATALTNGVVACRWCNRHKSARPVDEFLDDPDGDGVPGI